MSNVAKKPIITANQRRIPMGSSRKKWLKPITKSGATNAIDVASANGIKFKPSKNINAFVLANLTRENLHPYEKRSSFAKLPFW